MNQALKKTMLVSTAASMLFACNVGAVNVESNEYAYSIGVNHGLFGSDTGDFTDNVDYASICYGMIPEITNSYKNFTPTREYMFGNNPNGDRRIASKVVFLNGHGNHYQIIFNAGNDGGEYATGVTNDYDDTEVRASGYKYVGLKSTDMYTCDHISFVGCETGNTDPNQDASCVSRRAFWEGANSSLGFKEEITSRFFSGPDWLEVYNDHLASGYTIAQSVAAATAAYPNSDLGDSAVVWGDSYNKVASSSSRSSTEALYDEIEMINIEVSSVGTVSDFVASPMSLHTNDFSALINVIREEEEEFSCDDYKITVNMFGADSNVGLVKAVYYIGDTIQTNKAYVALIENGKIGTVYKTNLNSSEHNVVSKNSEVSEEELLALVKQHSSNKALDTIGKAEYKTRTDPIYSQKQNFFYDYRTNKLVAIDSVFYTSSALDDAIVDHTVETVLNKTK